MSSAGSRLATWLTRQNFKDPEQRKREDSNLCTLLRVSRFRDERLKPNSATLPKLAEEVGFQPTCPSRSSCLADRPGAAFSSALPWWVRQDLNLRWSRWLSGFTDRCDHPYSPHTHALGLGIEPRLSWFRARRVASYTTREIFKELRDKGSNLESPGSKPGVLPVTPSRK